VKEDLIKEKLGFIQERDRVYKDLENRIEKVIELEERLDEEKERKYALPDLAKPSRRSSPWRRARRAARSCLCRSTCMR
jgi:hypothetical protein